MFNIGSKQRFCQEVYCTEKGKLLIIAAIISGNLHVKFEITKTHRVQFDFNLGTATFKPVTMSLVSLGPLASLPCGLLKHY